MMNKPLSKTKPAPATRCPSLQGSISLSWLNHLRKVYQRSLIFIRQHGLTNPLRLYLSKCRKQLLATPLTAQKSKSIQMKEMKWERNRLPQKIPMSEGNEWTTGLIQRMTFVLIWIWRLPLNLFQRLHRRFTVPHVWQSFRARETLAVNQVNLMPQLLAGQHP